MLVHALPAFADASATASAQSDDLTARIQGNYDSLTGFEARFTQVLTNAASGQSETRNGEITFRQPRLIRWETDTPERELLLVGEDAVWSYFPEDATAIRYRPEEVLRSKTMLRFLSGRARLDEDFVITNQGPDGTAGGLTKLRLVPKEPEPSLVLGYVWVEEGSGMIRKVLLVDFYGNGNQVELADLRLNPDLDDELFRFTPPAGVVVEDNTAQAAQ